MDDREIELKLALAPDDLMRLRKGRCLGDGASGPPKIKHLFSIYFDTPDFALGALGLSLRLRRTDSGFVQTVKTAGTTTSGLFVRNEWEAPVKSECLDRAHLLTTGVDILADPALLDRLVPVFSTQVERTLYCLKDADLSWEIEVALDLGEVAAGALREPICEVELELVCGEADCLFRLARLLLEEVPARPMGVSKSERGYRLASGVALKPAKAKAPALLPESGVADAFQTIARACLDHLLLNERCLLAGGDGEAIHQMRVALRRLRSALKVFRSVLDGPQLEGIKAEIRWLLAHLGPARDSEVFLAEIIEPVLSKHPNDKQLQVLRTLWQADREAKLAVALTAVRDPRFCFMVLDIGQWVERGDWLSQGGKRHRRKLAAPVAPFAAKRQEKAMGKLVAAAGKGLRHLCHEDLHQVRILGKQLRYAGEFFASLMERKRSKAFLSELSLLQDLLGNLNDIAVAGPKLTGKQAQAGSARAAGLVAGWHHRRRSGLLTEAEKAWKRWRSCPLPWRE
ncbi:conserved hypothetical protein [Candidatus Terasakiella magnetica]|nr:conserved hypothetical protein [Candidatus Terasakiella magnetica]